MASAQDLFASRVGVKPLRFEKIRIDKALALSQ
jgi:hypothetical protein